MAQNEQTVSNNREGPQGLPLQPLLTEHHPLCIAQNTKLPKQQTSMHPETYRDLRLYSLSMSHRPWLLCLEFSRTQQESPGAELLPEPPGFDYICMSASLRGPWASSGASKNQASFQATFLASLPFSER